MYLMRKVAKDHGLFALFQKPKDKHQKVDDQVVVPEAGLDRADDASRVILFAPGALYKILPLFVAESSDCADHGLFALFQKPKDKHQKVDDQVVVPEAGLDRADDASRVVLFAPGALYKILPLFVAGSSDCADALEDLSKYSPDAVDGGVVAWPISHSRPNLREKKRDIEIVIKAQVLKANEPAAKADADAEPEAKTVTKEEL
ncbi:hypothetical protein BN1723_001358 [Verticillium longisporum]|uniref:Uncharacterized protein n=1 Tax=Verticillium longisporum TaxID=100787 RepID=A0A0G4NP40_VERLO|nr:hypothetical protein BN1723_001358 [Verticillium longisporum]